MFDTVLIEFKTTCIGAKNTTAIGDGNKEWSISPVHLRTGMKGACMPAIEMNVFDMCTIVSRDGEASLIGAKYINIIYMDIHDIVGSLRTNLEKIAIRIADDIPHFVIACGTGKAQ